MTVELRSRQAAAAIHAAVALVEPRPHPTRRFLGRRRLLALILAIATPPAGLAIAHAIRGGDTHTKQAIVDDARIDERPRDRVPTLGRDADRPTRKARPEGAPATDLRNGGSGQSSAASRAAASLSGRLAFTAMDKPVEHWANECAGGPCFYYNPSDIHTIDLRTRKTAPLVSSPLFEQGSAWSPDGSRLAYSVARGDTTAALHTIRADGSDDRTIVEVEGKLALQPTWSPDARKIAFALRQHATPYGVTCCPEIWMVDADGKNLHRIDELTFDDSSPWNPAWSPNGRHLAFARIGPTGGSEVWLLDLETRRLERFADGAEPAWSPDGERLAVATSDGHVQVFAVASRDWIAGIERTSLTLGAPAWSPDGNWIAFTLQVDPGAGSKRSIWVARSDGTDMSAIVTGDKDYWAPSWVR